MKLSNFKVEKITGDSYLNRKTYASVDVETGFLFWKKKERRQIFKPFGTFWYFADSGEFTPERQAECLARAWLAQTGQEV